MACVTEKASPDTPNGLVSSTLALAPDIMHVLEDLFTVCRVPFVTDFIFTQDAVADISMLTSPVQNEHAVAARIRTDLSAQGTGNEKATKAKHPCHSTDQSKAAGGEQDLLFCTIPSFSVGSITVGFCTSRKIPANATTLTKKCSKPHGTHSTTNTNPLKETISTTSNSSVRSTTQPTNSINYADGNPNLHHHQQHINSTSTTNGYYSAQKCPNNTDKTKTSPPDILSLVGNEPTQCNRFVRDDSRGVLLVVAEDATTKSTVFDCMQHRSSSRRTRICARFDSLQLREAILNTRDDSSMNKLTYALIPALQQLSVAYEQRTCPLCQSKSANCACVLPFRRPAHPLDFRYEQANMTLYTGRYDGFTTLRVFNKQTNELGVLKFSSSAANSRSVIKGNADRTIISALINSAVKQKLSSLSVHPIPFGQPSAMSSPFLVASLVNGFHHQQRRHQLQQLQDQQLQHQQLQHQQLQPFQLQQLQQQEQQQGQSMDLMHPYNHVQHQPHSQESPFIGYDTTKTPALIDLSYSPPATPHTSHTRQQQIRQPSPDLFLESAATPNQSMILQRNDTLDVLFAGFEPDTASCSTGNQSGTPSSPSPSTTLRRPIEYAKSVVEHNGRASVSNADVTMTEPIQTCLGQTLVPLGVGTPMGVAGTAPTGNTTHSSALGPSLFPITPSSLPGTLIPAATQSNVPSGSGTRSGSNSGSAGSGLMSTPPLSIPSPLLSNAAHTMAPIPELNDGQYGALVGNGNSRQPVGGRGQYSERGDESSDGRFGTTTDITMEQRQQEQDQSTKQQQQVQSHSHRRAITAEERAEKAEIRKQRNRIAAAKSNIKRKIRNESLRKDLADIQKRAAILRQQEKDLRAENVRLRSVAQQRHLNVGVHLSHIRLVP